MASFFLTLLSVAAVLNTALSLELHFYRNSCPQAEGIVKTIVKQYFQKDQSIAAGLIRLYFHDCFVNGCDASVLIDSTDENIAEKEAPPNLTLRGFEIIDSIKAALESRCNGIVSCADALALATRDSVRLSGGASYAIPTGRRDGTQSTMADVHIPSPSFSVPAALSGFQRINLTLVDLTTLLGAHSIGFVHCGFFADRLYNFQGTGLPDPTMDKNLLNSLQQRCPPSVVTIFNISKDPTVFLHQITDKPFTLDSSFYRNVLNNQAVLELDQKLAFTDVPNSLAAGYLARPSSFINQFSKSMIRLGSVGVLEGDKGQIRKDCRVVNP